MPSAILTPNQSRALTRRHSARVARFETNLRVLGNNGAQHSGGIRGLVFSVFVMAWRDVALIKSRNGAKRDIAREAWRWLQSDAARDWWDQLNMQVPLYVLNCEVAQLYGLRLEGAWQ